MLPDLPIDSALSMVEEEPSEEVVDEIQLSKLD